MVDTLVSAVLEKGAPDNVTVLWVEIVDDEDPAHSHLIGAAGENK